MVKFNIFLGNQKIIVWLLFKNKMCMFIINFRHLDPLYFPNQPQLFLLFTLFSPVSC